MSPLLRLRALNDLNIEVGKQGKAGLKGNI
jgi:hypothetical protein